ncbi:MAG TPA: SCO family protein [Sphingomicrobium sp.]|nr:SCO family protein [Sphingomicrobium sp.]
MTEKAPPRSTLKRVRLLLWLLIALAAAGTVALLAIRRGPVASDQGSVPAQSSFGGPFTLVGSDGKPFSSAKLMGKPYALYFGFTRCGDVCPTTLSRMVKLRQQAGGENAFHIVFVTIDPSNDGPKEVGQYAALFNSPIIGLTGSQPQINRVKKQYGIYAQPVPNAPMGQQMEHTATVLLFDANGKFVNTIATDEPDSDALAKLMKLAA